MCRWLAYSGGRIRLSDLLLDPSDNLIDQSLSSHAAATPTNGDGFGVGWYGEGKSPGLFRSIRPAWNDTNLRHLSYHIESSLFLAHVRASSYTAVQETNCHPFQFKNWLFVHNGEIFGIQKFRKELLMAVDVEYFENILGSTDSELMFHLALSFGLEQDPITAMARMVAFVEATGKKYGVEESVWMTVGLSDGKTLWAFRYSSDAHSPTLYLSPSIEELSKVNPAITERFSVTAQAVVSEPIGQFRALWTEIPEGQAVTVHEGDVQLAPFSPQSSASR